MCTRTPWRRRSTGDRRTPATLGPLLALAVILAASGCERFPQDPDRTLERALEGSLKIGVTEAPPWVIRNGDSADGIEPTLLEAFAREHGMTIQWHWGTESQNLEALRARRLHVVAAGLSASTPWRTHLALTKPYYTERETVGGPASPPLTDLEGREIAVRWWSPLAARLEARGAVPIGVDDPFDAESLIAAARWELLGRGLAVSDEIELRRVKHVLAVPRGENAMLIAVESMFERVALDIEARLREEATP